VILIRKVAEPFGWLGNMSPFPVIWSEKLYRTTEALFQAMRFEEQNVIEAIRMAKSPMTAKMVAKRDRNVMVVEPRSSRDVENMRTVLRLKLEQHPHLKQELIATGDQSILEDCSKRPHGSGLFWGSALQDGQWVGQNMLGRLWMECRDELRAETSARSRPDIHLPPLPLSEAASPIGHRAEQDSKQKSTATAKGSISDVLIMPPESPLSVARPLIAPG
jgi:N-glycosidase YbiA